MTEQHPVSHGSERASMISNVLGIVGLIILAIIVLWGLFHIATLFGGSSKTSAGAITVSAPTNVTAGEPTTISWKYAPKQSGAYAFLYQCKSGFQFSYPSGNTHIPIPCGAAYTLGNASSSVTVLPLLAGTSTVAVPVTIVYIPSTMSSGAAPIQGTVTINVHPGSGSSALPTPVVTQPKPTKPAGAKLPSSTGTKTTHVPEQSGPADLSIRLVSLSADSYGNGVAIFDISNVGGSTSVSYTFQAQLPTMQPYTYTSVLQAPLSPGSHIENTLRFSQAVPGLFTVTVSGDSSTANNTAGQYLSTAYRAY